MNITHEIAEYVEEFEEIRPRLVDEWLEHPDHIAIKAANTQHFEALLKQIRKGSWELGEVKRIISTNMNDGRRITTVILAGSLTVGSLGEVRRVEVMEPRPDKVGKDKVGLDHVEVYWPHLKQAEDHLTTIVGIIPKKQSNASHNTLNIIFGNQREFKLSDRQLTSIVNQDVREGRGEIIYEN